MNALTRVVACGPLALAMSGWLQHEVECRTETDEFRRSLGGGQRHIPTPALRQEARELLAAHAASIAPPSRAELLAWLRPLNAAVRNPQSEQDFPMRCAAIGAVVSDLPASAFNEFTQRAAMRKFLFWPSAGDVYELLSEQAGEAVRIIAALRSIATAPDPMTAPREPQAAPPTDDERAAVAAQIAALKAEVRAQDEATPMHMRGRFNGPTGDALEALRAGNPLVQGAREFQRRAGK